MALLQATVVVGFLVVFVNVVVVANVVVEALFVVTDHIKFSFGE